MKCRYCKEGKSSCTYIVHVGDLVNPGAKNKKYHILLNDGGSYEKVPIKSIGLVIGGNKKRSLKVYFDGKIYLGTQQDFKVICRGVE